MSLTTQTLLDYVKDSIEIFMRMNIDEMITKAQQTTGIYQASETYCLNCLFENKILNLAKEQTQTKNQEKPKTHINVVDKVFQKLSRISAPSESLVMVLFQYEKQLIDDEKEKRISLETENKLRLEIEILEQKLLSSASNIHDSNYKKMKQLIQENDRLKRELGIHIMIKKQHMSNDQKIKTQLKMLREQNKEQLA